ncbi:hypothetical protein DFH09DRAFT_1301003 [Mycena vulgaris]|nr:hypothetical protein DFH09DRAFT_1301003 [Mycena vulgaris]
MPPATPLPLTTPGAVRALNVVVLAQCTTTHSAAVRGLVFPTGGEEPMWARVGVRDGVTGLDGIDYKPWISAGLPSHLAVVDFMRCTTRVDHTPMGVRLRHSFCLYFADQAGPKGAVGQWSHPVNNIVDHLARDTPKPWVGNVLAVKCTNGPVGYTDFEHADIAVVVRILRSDEWCPESEDAEDLSDEEDAEDGEQPLVASVIMHTTLVPQMEWDKVEFTRAHVEAAEETSKTILAWLIPDGTHVQDRVWVRVPIHRGVARPTSVDELNTEIWFDAGRGVASPTSDLTGRSYQVDRFPLDAPRDMEHSYTFVVAPQHSTGHNVHAANAAVNRFVPELLNPWRGNVLVFRHGKTASKRLVDVDEQSWIAVKLILATVIREGIMF